MNRRFAAVLAAVLVVGGIIPPAAAAADATPDEYVALQGSPLTVPAAHGVLSNDVVGLPPVTAVVDGQPANASDFDLNADGSLTYTSVGGFSGVDTFTYHSVDGLGLSSSVVSVSITVRTDNAPPVAVEDCSDGQPFPLAEDSDAVTTPGGVGFDCSLDTNDSDPDGDPLLDFEIVAGPDHGAATIDALGSWTYQPDPDYTTHQVFSVSDSFSYRVSDGTAWSEPADMRFWIAPVNDAPSFTPGADLVEVSQGSGAYSAPWATGVAAGPPDESDQSVTFEVTVRPEDEQAFTVQPAISPTGTLTFTPAAVWLAEVTVVAHDDGGLEDYNIPGVVPDDTSDEATFQIVIQPTSGEPTAVPPGPVAATEDASAAILLGGTDADGETVSFDVAEPSHGSLDLGPRVCSATVPRTCQQAATYTPDANYAGPDSFTYTVSDATSTSAPATVSITVEPVADAPAASNDAVATIEDGAGVTIDPRTNDADADGDALSVTGVTQGTKGTVGFTGSSVTYTPAANAFGADAFTYTVGDGTGRSDAATVSVTVGAVNDVPSFTKGANQTAAEDAGPRSVTGWATAISPGPSETGQAVGFGVTANTNPGLFAIQPAVSASGTLTYTSAANKFGTATVAVRITDTGGIANGGVNASPSQSFTITVSPVNDPPNAVNDVTLKVAEGAPPTTLAVLANDTWLPDAVETLTIVARTNGANGTVTIAAGGRSLTYQPKPLFDGTDTFTYTISDGHGGTDVATVLVTVVRDTIAPAVATPVQYWNGGTMGTSSASLRVFWSGTDSGSGVARYEIQQGVNGGSFTSIALATPGTTSVDRTVSFGSTYQFRVRAIDGEGNVSAWVAGPAVEAVKFEENTSLMAYSGTWTRTANTSASGGATRYATSTASRAVFTFTGRDVALVSSRYTTSGRARFYVDGALVATVDLDRASFAARQVVFQRHFSTLAKHTLEIRPYGDGRVDIDALLVTR
jgi:large repetitive protein